MVNAWVILIIAILIGVLTWWFRRSVADAIAAASFTLLIVGAISAGAAARNILPNIVQNGRINEDAAMAALRNNAGSVAAVGWLSFLSLIALIYVVGWAIWKIYFAYSPQAAIRY